MSAADVGYDDASNPQLDNLVSDHSAAAAADAEAAPLLSNRNSSANKSIVSATNLLNMTGTMRKLFTQRDFVCWFIFKILFFAQVFVVGLFIPLYAAEWFGGCLEGDNITPIDGCAPDYTTYAYWSTMFFSIAGFITFLVSSSVGFLSDKYGRKVFFVIAILTWAVPRTVMIFYINFYLYFGLSLLTSINGGDFFIASKGYLADIIPNKDERLIGYGFGQSAVGIGCILGAVIAVSISVPFNDHAVFIALGGWNALLLIFVIFFMREPPRFSDPTFLAQRDAELNSTTACASSMNPFAYLGKVCKYKLILYLTLLSLLMAWAESGIMTSLFAYIGSEFGLERQGDSAIVYAVFAFLMASAVVLAGFLLMPFKKLYDELSIMVIAVAFKIAAFALLASISLWPSVCKNFGVLYLAAVFYGTSFLIWPTITGLLTKYMAEDEQGLGFGILDAWTSIASIVAPFSFGQLYVFSSTRNVAYLLFAVAIAFCGVSIVVIVGPLRNAVTQQKRKLELVSGGREAERDVEKGKKKGRGRRGGSHSEMDEGLYDELTSDAVQDLGKIMDLRSVSTSHPFAERKVISK